MNTADAGELAATVRRMECAVTNRDVEIYRLRNERNRLEAKLATYDEAALQQLVEDQEISGPPAQRIVLIAQAEELHDALVHVAGCRDACDECRKVARAAMNHENLNDFLEGL